MSNETKHIEAFECPYCGTLNEKYRERKGVTYIICCNEDCDRVFYGKLAAEVIFISRKEKYLGDYNES